MSPLTIGKSSGGHWEWTDAMGPDNLSQSSFQTGCVPVLPATSNGREDILLAVAVVVSQLAISNHVTVARYCSQMLYLVWGLLALNIIFVKKNFVLNGTTVVLLVAYLLTFLQNKFFYFAGHYLTGGLGVARTLPYCIAFYIIGLNTYRSQRNLHLLCWSYITGVFLLMLFRRISGVALNMVDKNAIGAVSGGGLLLTLFLIHYGKVAHWQKILLYTGGVFIFSTLIAMHTRTPVAALLVAIFGGYALKHKKRNVILMGTLLLVLMFVMVPHLLQYKEVHDYIQGTKHNDELTLNSITSDRLIWWEKAWNDITAHPWIGQGGWAYVDCFPLYVLRQGGLLSAFILFSISYWKFFRILQMCRTHWQRNYETSIARDYLLELGATLVIFYFAVSLCEGLVPFRPGTSTFFLWIILGLFDANQTVIDSKEAFFKAPI